jgi:hypothetical protein
MSKLLFVQLGGERKSLILADHAAPFGRAHKDELVTDTVTVRETEVYCAGSNVPVRHIFGLRNEPWEFHGRFSDYWGGAGFAAAKTAEVKRFVAAAQPVRIAWNDQLSAKGLIKSFEPKRETDRETEWKLTVLIDSDDLLGQLLKFPTQRQPTDYTNLLLLYSTEIDEAFKEIQFKKGIFDALDDLISNVSEVTSFAVSVANELQSFESGFIGTLRRFRTAVGQVSTAVAIARNAIDSLPVDLAIERANYDAQFAFLRGQSIISDSAISMLALADEADKQAAIAERGKVLAIHEAKGGETFESISTKYYGSATRASDIRSANGVASGQPPVAGDLYSIPI